MNKQIKTDETENNLCKYHKTVGGNYYYYYYYYYYYFFFFINLTKSLKIF